MSPGLAQALRRLEVAQKAETLRHGWSAVPPWVFCDDAGRPLKEQRVERWFKRVLKVANLPGHFSPHALRHTYASLLLADGVSPVYVQRQLGHASIRLTADLYGRWLPIEGRGAVDRLDDPKDATNGSSVVAEAGVGPANPAVSNAWGPPSGPTGPRWAPLSRTRAR